MARHVTAGPTGGTRRIITTQVPPGGLEGQLIELRTCFPGNTIRSKDRELPDTLRTSCTRRSPGRELWSPASSSQRKRVNPIQSNPF